MDPLSHALLGGLAAKTVSTSRRRFWVMTLLGMVPDVDVLANGFGAWAAPFQHRGLTHSFLGVVVMTFFFSFLFHFWDEGPFWPRTIQYSFPLFLHLGGDFLTSFGVPFFAPFSYRGYCLDIIGNITPIIIVVMGGGIYWLSVRGRSGWRSTMLLWGFLVGYILVLVGGKTYAGTLTPGFTLVPSTVNPIVWRAVQFNSSDHSYHLIETNVLSRRQTERKPIPIDDEDPRVKLTLRSNLVQEFLHENRWPVTRIVQQPDGWRVEWGTLLFSMKGMVRGKVAVEISPSGDILQQRKIFTFWDPN